MIWIWMAIDIPIWLTVNWNSPFADGSSIPLQSTDKFHEDDSLCWLVFDCCISRGVSEPQQRDAFHISNWANNVEPAYSIEPEIIYQIKNSIQIRTIRLNQIKN